MFIKQQAEKTKKIYSIVLLLCKLYNKKQYNKLLFIKFNNRKTTKSYTSMLNTV